MINDKEKQDLIDEVVAQGNKRRQACIDDLRFYHKKEIKELKASSMRNLILQRLLKIRDEIYDEALDHGGITAADKAIADFKFLDHHNDKELLDLYDQYMGFAG